MSEQPRHCRTNHIIKSYLLENYIRKSYQKTMVPVHLLERPSPVAGQLWQQNLRILWSVISAVAGLGIQFNLCSPGKVTQQVNCAVSLVSLWSALCGFSSALKRRMTGNCKDRNESITPTLWRSLVRFSSSGIMPTPPVHRDLRAPPRAWLRANREVTKPRPLPPVCLPTNADCEGSWKCLPGPIPCSWFLWSPHLTRSSPMSLPRHYGRPNISNKSHWESSST